MSRINVWILFFAAWGFGTARAVETKNCPPVLETVQENLRLEVPIDALLQLLRQKPEFQSEQETSVRVAYQNTQNTPAWARKWKLTQPENGRCVYRGHNEEKLELFTQRDEHTLMAQIAMGPSGILLRTYVRVAQILPTQVLLHRDFGPAYLAVPRYPYDSYTVGGPLVKVGVIGKIQVQAHNKKRTK